MKPVDRDDWLESVPLEAEVDEDESASIHFSALLISASSRRIRLLVGDALIEIHSEDVVEMDESNDIVDGAAPKFGRWVDLSLRRPSRLLTLERAEATRVGSVLGQTPFAFATRSEQPVIPANEKYDALVRAYLHRHGLKVPYFDPDTGTSI